MSNVYWVGIGYRYGGHRFIYFEFTFAFAIAFSYTTVYTNTHIYIYKSGRGGVVGCPVGDVL